MPSSILPQNHDEQELYNAISSFFYKFHLGNLLRIKISLCQALLASMPFSFSSLTALFQNYYNTDNTQLFVFCSILGLALI